MLLNNMHSAVRNEHVFENCTMNLTTGRMGDEKPFAIDFSKLISKSIGFIHTR